MSNNKETFCELDFEVELPDDWDKRLWTVDDVETLVTQVSQYWIDKFDEIVGLED